MATILIEKLLAACVKQDASDIHLTVGQPPVFRIDGSLRKLETKVLDSEDTVALMKSITPDRYIKSTGRIGHQRIIAYGSITMCCGIGS